MTEVPHLTGALTLVHPDLLSILNACPQTPQAFEVIHGLRTPAEEARMVAQGHSTTLHSRHLANSKGFACAVDVAALVNGHVSWETGLYAAIAHQMKETAARLGIPVTWGGDWRTFHDYGHFELPWNLYP